MSVLLHGRQKERLIVVEHRAEGARVQHYEFVTCFSAVPITAWAAMGATAPAAGAAGTISLGKPRTLRAKPGGDAPEIAAGGLPSAAKRVPDDVKRERRR